MKVFFAVFGLSLVLLANSLPSSLHARSKQPNRISSIGAQQPFQQIQTIAPGQNPFTVAFSPNNLLAAVTFFNGTAIYKITSNGQFSFLGNVDSGQGSFGLAFSPDGTMAAITSVLPGNVTFYSVDYSSGTFNPIINFPETQVSNPESVIFSPDGLLAAVVHGGETSPYISLYAINSAQKSVVPLGTTSIGSDPGPIAFSPDSKLAILTDDSGQASIFSVNNGNFSYIGSLSAGTAPQAAAFSPTTNTVAISNLVSSNVSLFYVNTQSGQFTPFQTIPAGKGPGVLAFSPNGKLAAVVNTGSNNVSVYSVSANGTFKQIQLVTAGNFPTTTAFSPKGNLAAVVNSESNNVYIFSVGNAQD